MLNLKRCKFLSWAYNYIREHPGCSKSEVIMAYNGHTRVPNDTYSYQNQALNRLIEHGLVVDARTKGNAYCLYPVGYIKIDEFLTS